MAGTRQRAGGGGGYSLGVDLGTTYTAAAVWLAGWAEIVPLGDQVRPPQGSPWGRLLSLPGALLVLGLLFGAAYAESLLRPLLRRRQRVNVRTVLGMAAVDAVFGAVLVLGTWILGSRLLVPVSGAAVIVLTTAAGGLLPLGIEGRAARATATATIAPRR